MDIHVSGMTEKGPMVQLSFSVLCLSLGWRIYVEASRAPERVSLSYPKAAILGVDHKGQLLDLRQALLKPCKTQGSRLKSRQS